MKLDNKYLKNIIDDDLIDVKINTANIKYAKKSVGNQKITYNKLTKPHLFSIVGDMNKYYRLDSDSIPQIKGNITKKPINVIFTIVSKVFDGTNSTLNLFDNLEFNKNYFFISASINDSATLVPNLPTIRYGVNDEISYLETLENEYVINYKLSDITMYNDVSASSKKSLILTINHNTDNISSTIKFPLQIETPITKYDYKNSVTGEYSISDIIYTSVNASNYLIPITMNMTLNSELNVNYEIKKIIAYGRITKRPLKLNFNLKDKIYDGTNYCEIEGDPDVSNAVTEYKPTFIFKNDAFRFKSIDVGRHEIIETNLNLKLLNNYNNYYIEGITFSNTRTIKKRDIKVKFKKLIYNRTYKKITLEYEFENDIKTDRLSISPKYKLIDKNELEIISTYFNYSSADKYNDIWSIYKLNENSIDIYISITSDNFEKYDSNHYLGYTNDTKNIYDDSINLKPEDLVINENLKVSNNQYWFYNDFKLVSSGKSNYYETINASKLDKSSGNISYISNELGFVSADLNYRLKNKDVITITNVLLNPDNEKSNNYNLINANDLHQVVLEII